MAFPIGELGEAFANKYELLTAKAKHLFPWAYFYPRRFLHITVGPPCLFTSEPLMREELRDDFESAWKEKLSASAALREIKRFQLGYGRIQVDKTAGIFLVEDSSESITKIRAILKDISDEIQQRNSEYPAIRIPSIVHSTFLRFVEEPNVNEAEMEERIKSLQEFWNETIIVEAQELVFIREVNPYLHQPSGHVITTVKYK